MLLRLITSCCLTLVLCIGTSQAQDEPEAAPGALVVSYFKCDFGDLGDIANETDSLNVPIFKELVAEGKLWGYGMMGHDWAGYENVLRWYAGESKQQVFDAVAEQGRRLQERHPDAEQIACHGHRDGVYRLGPNTGPPARKPGTTAISFFQCETSKLDAISDATEKMALPIWKEMVASGDYDGVGIAIHDWAGYENVVMWRHAKDKAALFAAVSKYGELFAKRYPDLEPGTGPMQGCNTHRDQIYWYGPSTNDFEAQSNGDM